MWKVTELSIREAKPNSWWPTSFPCLVSGATVLAWPVELGDWSAPTIKVLSCHCCGSPSCPSGGWISLRRAGEIILVTPGIGPATVGARRGGPFTTGYPTFIYGECSMRRFSERIPYLDRDAFSRLGAMVRQLPDFEQIPSLSSSEAAHLHSLESAMPEPSLNRMRRIQTAEILGTDWSTSAHAAVLFNRIYRQYYRSGKPVLLRPTTDSDRIVTFRVHCRGEQAWRPIAVGLRPSLFFEPGFVIEAA